MPKRRASEAAVDDDPTPRKTRRGTREDAEPVSSPQVTPAGTPSGRKSILRGTPSKLNGTTILEPTPKSLRKVLFTTPLKPDEANDHVDEATPTAVRNDRSARRKSQRILQAKDDSEDEDVQADEEIAQQILDEDGSEDEDEDGDATLNEAPLTADTPTKTGKLRGRPKGRRRERTPSPPPDLPPHESYFFQTRAGGNKTSANTLPSHLLLGHDDYFAQINTYKDPHAADMERLKRLHERSFDQWVFELDEGFNICLYGYGSKRELVMEFADHLCARAEDVQSNGSSCPGKKTKRDIVVVNGYTPGLTVRDILQTVGNVICNGVKIPAQPVAMLESIMATLPDVQTSLMTLIIHSLDHANLRKSTTQAMIARLASHPAISLLATCDTPNFPLLWDVSHTRQLRFLYHDATTFQPYRVEIDVVEEVNTLLGRNRRRLGGKDGVAYVLKSLPENARNLFRILVAEQLALADSGLPITHDIVGSDDEVDPDDLLGASDDEAALAEEQNTPSRRARGRGRPAKKAKVRPVARVAMQSVIEGVEYRTLYHKAVEEFVCSSELNFRTLLKEFHDHQMVESRRDAAGTERLSVPMSREELEAVLEELV